MKIVLGRILYVIVLLVFNGNSLAQSLPDRAASNALLEICRQLEVTSAAAPMSFTLFGMPSAFVRLDLDIPVENFLKRLHGTATPFVQMTRVGNRLFYTGGIDNNQLTLQLLVDVTSKETTQALLSAVAFTPALHVVGQDEMSAYRPQKRRILQLLPAGGKLLMDICYEDSERTCHQVYHFAHTDSKRLETEIRNGLILANWRHYTGPGMSTWIRYGLTVRYMMENAGEGTALYLIAPGVLW